MKQNSIKGVLNTLFYFSPQSIFFQQVAYGQSASGLVMGAASHIMRSENARSGEMGCTFSHEAAQLRSSIQSEQQRIQQSSAELSGDFGRSGAATIVRSVSPCVHNHNCHSSTVLQSGVINKQIGGKFRSQDEGLILVEKNSRDLKKAKYENELKNLRKNNVRLEEKLNAHSEENIKMELNLSNPRAIAAGVALKTQSQILQQKRELPNPYENKKKLVAMANIVQENVRKEALSKQQDGLEVAEMKVKRDFAEDTKIKTQTDLEKENQKLKGKAIRAQFEMESYEDKLKDTENQKYIQQQETKNKQSDLRAKLNELSTLASKKMKVETDMTSAKLLLKDKEGEITRQQDKLKLNATERIKTLQDLELNIQKRNIASMDFEKVRQDRDRIVEETEKRQLEADNKYEELTQKQLWATTELQKLEQEVTVLENVIGEEKKEFQSLELNYKSLIMKREEFENIERRLRKKEKTIMSLEQELELVRREKKIEIVEKVIERPIVVEKPVIVEKEVVVREEIKIDEPLEKELQILREEAILMADSLKSRQSEAEFLKKKFQEGELQNKHSITDIQNNLAAEKQGMQMHYERGIEEIQVLQGKLNSMLAEIHQLSSINITKNREIQDQLNVLARDNRTLDNALSSTTTLLPQYSYYKNL